MAIDIKHIAKLTNIPLKKEEEEKLEKQLGATIEYIKELNQIDTSSTGTTNTVTGTENVFRDDVIEPSLTQDQATANMKKQHNGLAMVPAVLEEED